MRPEAAYINGRARSYVKNKAGTNIKSIFNSGYLRISLYTWKTYNWDINLLDMAENIFLVVHYTSRRLVQ